MGKKKGAHLLLSSLSLAKILMYRNILASPVARLVKNLPAIRETWIRFLGWEEPLEEGMAIHSSILAWRISMDRGA